MKNKFLLIIITCTMLACTPFEREIAEEVAVEVSEGVIHYVESHGCSAPKTTPTSPQGANGAAQPRVSMDRRNKDWPRGVCNNRQYPRRHKIKDYSERVKYG